MKGNYNTIQIYEGASLTICRGYLRDSSGAFDTEADLGRLDVAHPEVLSSDTVDRQAVLPDRPGTEPRCFRDVLEGLIELLDRRVSP